MSNPIARQIIASNQTEAAKHLNALHREGNLSTGVLIAVATEDTRKHVQKTAARLAKKLGFESLDALLADGNEWGAVDADGLDHEFEGIDSPAVEAAEAAIDADLPTDEDDFDDASTVVPPLDEADPFAAALAAPIEETVAKKKSRIARPDFALVDWELAPVLLDSTPELHRCPRCGLEAKCDIDIENLFGFRKMKRWNAKEGAHFAKAPQSNCRKCRSAHAKERREAKKAAAEAAAATK